MTIEYTRILLPKDRFERIRRFAIHKGYYFFAGASSISIPKRGEKYILEDKAIEWADKHGEMIMMTAGEIARVELARTFPTLSRVGWTSRHIRYFDIAPPTFFLRPEKGSLCYVDLKAAYWQIYQKLWLDVHVPRGRGKLSMLPLAKRLGTCKPARNAVIGVIRSRNSMAFKGKKRIFFKAENRFLAPELWATIQFILHELAVFAKVNNAVYCSTDGYIFRSDEAGLTDFLSMLRVCNLEHTIREGEGEVIGWGRWKIGDKETKIFKMGPTGSLSNLQLFTKEEPVMFLDWWNEL